MWSSSRNNISTLGAWVLIVGVLGFFTGLVSMLPWVSSVKTQLMAFSSVAIGAATAVFTASTWRSRGTVFMWGRDVVYSERPTSYHFLAALGMGFSLVLLIGGFRMAWAQIAAI